jgi:hypothetical protein
MALSSPSTYPWPHRFHYSPGYPNVITFFLKPRNECCAQHLTSTHHFRSTGSIYLLALNGIRQLLKLFAVVGEQVRSVGILDPLLTFFFPQPLEHLVHWIHV